MRADTCAHTFITVKRTFSAEQLQLEAFARHHFMQAVPEAKGVNREALSRHGARETAGRR